MTELNKNMVKEIAGEMEKLVKSLEEKYNVKIDRSKGIKYNETEFDMSFKVVVNDPKKVEDKSRKEFEDWARYFGVNPAGFGQTYVSNGKTLKVVGFNSRAPKFPIILEDLNGAKYKGTVDSYKRHFPM